MVAASASNSGRNAVNALLGSTFACSFSFALPTASGPNIVVYGTGQARLLFPALTRALTVTRPNPSPDLLP